MNDETEMPGVLPQAPPRIPAASETGEESVRGIAPSLPTPLGEEGDAARAASQEKKLRIQLAKAQLFSTAFGSVSVDEVTGEVRPPIDAEGIKSSLHLLADRESSGGTNRTRESQDKHLTKGTYHITLDTARTLRKANPEKFDYVNQFQGNSDEVKRSFAQRMVDNPAEEKTLAEAVLAQKFSELENAGVKIDQLSQNERNAIGLLFFNTGTGKSPKLIRNLAALTNYRVLFGPSPTSAESMVLEQLRQAVAGEMDHVKEDGNFRRGLALRRLAEQDMFLTGEDTLASYQSGDRAQTVNTDPKAERRIREFRENGKMLFNYATDYLKTHM